MVKNQKKIIFRFDLTPNALKNPQIRKQIEKELKDRYNRDVSGIIERWAKVHPFITDKGGFYLKLLEEAKITYRSGLNYATISMVGITAERFSIELGGKLRFRVNKNPISKNDIFGDRFNQQKRLRMLYKAKLIKKDIFENLDKIRIIRNKYIHPKKKRNPGKDSLKVLNLMIDVLQSDFSHNYELKNGKIV
ncbi:MAG: hypothetical protein ABIF08_04875, partial [Nanoarchaeota archaeon]